MSKIKFVTKYDYFLATISIACCIFILLIYRSPITIALASLILLIGVHKSFSRRIFFREESINIRSLNTTKKLAYSDVSKLTYTTKLYGKSFITISCSKISHKALLGYREWVKLKAWMENKGIECEENR